MSRFPFSRKWKSSRLIVIVYALPGGPELRKKSARSDVALEDVDVASRGSNFFIMTRFLGADCPPPAKGLDELDGTGLYLSTPGGMLTWIGM